MTTTRTRHRRIPTPPADPTHCGCPTGPTTIARFVDAELISVEHRHLITCGRDSTWTPPRDYAPAVTSVRVPRGGWR